MPPTSEAEVLMGGAVLCVGTNGAARIDGENAPVGGGLSLLMSWKF